jgi:hypothetical protein
LTIARLNDPRVTAGQTELEQRVIVYFRARPRNADLDTASDLRTIARDHRTEFKKQHGVDFPRLVPFIVPSIGEVKLLPADWSSSRVRRELAILIGDYAKRGITVPAVELAQAVSRTWPRFRPRRVIGLN